MTRCCLACEWSRPNARLDDGPADYLACKEGPVEHVKAPNDWCGRFRVAERLTGGTDARRAAA